MSPADSSVERTGGPYRKPRADLYTVLLVFALIAVLLGILCLYFENEMYDWDHKGGPTASANHSPPLARVLQPWPLNPVSSTDAPTTVPLLQLRSGG